MAGYLTGWKSGKKPRDENHAGARAWRQNVSSVYNLFFNGLMEYPSASWRIRLVRIFSHGYFIFPSLS